MSGKGRQVEVTSARNRLDETLQHLVDRKEEGPGDDIDVTSFSEEPAYSKIPASPKKPIIKPGRKRKRRADSSDGESPDEHTVIMKLFDRSVDLALFPEDTPLYPVCRAWIQNKPHDKSLGTLANESTNTDIKPNIDDELKESFIWELPPPIKSEDGCLYDLRIPQGVPQPNETLDIHADPRSAPPAERLLLNHMARWKQIRNRWHGASQMNEMQYAGSIQILKDMYNGSMMVENT